MQGVQLTYHGFYSPYPRLGIDAQCQVQRQAQGRAQQSRHTCSPLNNAKSQNSQEECVRALRAPPLEFSYGHSPDETTEDNVD